MNTLKIITPEITKELEIEFRQKFIDGPGVYEHFNKYTENGIGSSEVRDFPDTKLHRELYPELYNFEFYNFICYIRRNSGYWYGYVKTEKYHPIWNNRDKIDVFMHGHYAENIDVHGGISYINEENFTIGFDCSHYCDESPFRRTAYADREYRTRDYVIHELNKVCHQLYSMLPKWSPKTHHQFPKKMRDYYFSLYKIFYLRKQSPDLCKLYEKDLWIKIVADAY